MGHCSIVNYYKVFRKAASHYFTKKIQPFLTLPGVVELDETYVGMTKFSMNDAFPNIRWIFGLHCRSTKICLMYFIKDKNHDSIMKAIK